VVVVVVVVVDLLPEARVCDARPTRTCVCVCGLQRNRTCVHHRIYFGLQWRALLSRTITVPFLSEAIPSVHRSVRTLISLFLTSHHQPLALTTSQRELCAHLVVKVKLCWLSACADVERVGRPVEARRVHLNALHDVGSSPAGERKRDEDLTGGHDGVPVWRVCERLLISDRESHFCVNSVKTCGQQASDDMQPFPRGEMDGAGLEMVGLV
jgi:hypothetical protein